MFDLNDWGEGLIVIDPKDLGIALDDPPCLELVDCAAGKALELEQPVHVNGLPPVGELDEVVCPIVDDGLVLSEHGSLPLCCVGRVDCGFV